MEMRKKCCFFMQRNKPFIPRHKKHCSLIFTFILFVITVIRIIFKVINFYHYIIFMVFCSNFTFSVFCYLFILPVFLCSLSLSSVLHSHCILLSSNSPYLLPSLYLFLHLSLGLCSGQAQHVFFVVKIRFFGHPVEVH